MKTWQTILTVIAGLVVLYFVSTFIYSSTTQQGNAFNKFFKWKALQKFNAAPVTTLPAGEETSADNFQAILKSQKPCLVLFHSDRCGFCKQFAPEFDKAVAALEEMKKSGSLKDLSDLQMVKLSDTQTMKPLKDGKTLLDNTQVTGFPTLVLYKDGKEKARYEGDRTSQSVIDFVQTSLTD
jgi:thiol-disulfide isomerase/thioredoxin